MGINKHFGFDENGQPIIAALTLKGPGGISRNVRAGFSAVYYGMINANVLFSQQDVDLPELRDSLRELSHKATEHRRAYQENQDKAELHGMAQCFKSMAEIMQSYGADRICLPQPWHTEDGQPGPGQMMLNIIRQCRLPVWITFRQTQTTEKHVVYQHGVNMPSMAHEVQRVKQRELLDFLFKLNAAMSKEDADFEKLFQALDLMGQKHEFWRIRLLTKAQTPEATRIEAAYNSMAKKPTVQIYYNHPHTMA